jgi:glycosyltransferase involved in cell wall biosynthesis
LILIDADRSDQIAVLDSVNTLGLSDRVDVEICHSGNRRLFLERGRLCLYHSGNRFYPYPALEALAAGVPVLTDDRVFAAEFSGQADGRTDQAEAVAGQTGVNTGQANGLAGSVDGIAAPADGFAGSADGLTGQTDAMVEPAVGFGCLADFNGGEETPRFILDLLYDRSRYEQWRDALLPVVESRHSFDDMVAGVYDVYVRGLRA